MTKYNSKCKEMEMRLRTKMISNVFYHIVPCNEHNDIMLY